LDGLFIITNLIIATHSRFRKGNEMCVLIVEYNW